MSYTDMEPEELTGTMWDYLNEIALIAHAQDKCFVIIANGKGENCTFNVIDTEATDA